MNETRRDVIRLTGVFSLLASLGLLSPEQAVAQQRAWNKAAFETRSLADTLKALGGTAAAQSKDIAITAPDIAENGAVVPLTVASKLPNTQSVYILVEKNPNMLSAGFHIPAGTEPTVTTRIKMAETSNVLALVKSNNQFYVASREIRVTLGGCGG